MLNSAFQEQTNKCKDEMRFHCIHQEAKYYNDCTSSVSSIIIAKISQNIKLCKNQMYGILNSN